MSSQYFKSPSQHKSWKTKLEGTITQIWVGLSTILLCGYLERDNYLFDSILESKYQFGPTSFNLLIWLCICKTKLPFGPISISLLGFHLEKKETKIQIIFKLTKNTLEDSTLSIQSLNFITTSETGTWFMQFATLIVFERSNLTEIIRTSYMRDILMEWWVINRRT